MSTSRLEAFSDGVIAVAITLLVLNLPGLPAPPGQSLQSYLGGHWPEFVAYIVSFVTIGIIWINHHSMISRLARGDHVILIANLLLLMTIVFLPFTTNLMATYLKLRRGENFAAGVYAGSFLVMGLAFALLNYNILLRRPQLLGPPMPDAERRRVFLRAMSGVLPYVLAVAVAPFSAYATVAICGATAAFYALPFASGR